MRFPQCSANSVARLLQKRIGPFRSAARQADERQRVQCGDGVGMVVSQGRGLDPKCPLDQLLRRGVVPLDAPQPRRRQERGDVFRMRATPDNLRDPQCPRDPGLG